MSTIISGSIPLGTASCVLKDVDTAITVSNTTRLLPTFFFFIVVGPPDTQNEVANRGRAPAHSTDFPSKSKGRDYSTSILFKLRQKPTLIALEPLQPLFCPTPGDMKRGPRCDYLNLSDVHSSESNEVPLLETYRAGLEYTFVHRRPQFLENDNEDGYCNIFDKLTTHNVSECHQADIEGCLFSGRVQYHEDVEEVVILANQEPPYTILVHPGN
ncbi:hypothetical protein An11g04950 [Aspergillus niger]|uniref:Uncharacterized protein n=2 Tax=Aspergillus niger TaxID=5061 RepID=A2QWF4_ASPNC|nr:hypothetical protein An11g04950 [Aspergillus niger]CAK40700.1 hypothetical protein An11g04950 [Aspergillus niger]